MWLHWYCRSNPVVQTSNVKETKIQSAFEHLQTDSQLARISATKNQTVPWLTNSQIDQSGPKSWGGRQSSKLTIYLRQILWQLMSRMFLLQLIFVPPPTNRRLGRLGAKLGGIKESDTGHSFAWKFPETCLTKMYLAPNLLNTVILCWSCHMTSIHLVLMLHQDVCGSEPQLWCWGPKENWLNPF